jgi:exoribonuclease R
MTLYKIKIANRNYETWQVYNASTMEPILIDDLNPINHKLLNDDVFIYNKGKVEILKSNIRTNENIAAVLILDNNKTYGRENKNSFKDLSTKDLSTKEGKLLYKCVPNDTSIPIFLVPYEIKQMGFSKVFNNLYVTIRFNHWLEKHPRGILSLTIGPVDIIDNFYEYQLYCKNLNISLKEFNKTTTNSIKQKAHIHDSFITDIFKKYPNIEDRTSWKTFTIDPSGSQDFDDGFSIKSLGSNGQKTLLSIYIANVSIWLDCLNLWPAFSERISTIYLPNRKIPMLPNILSDCLCSLQSNARRFAFTMDIIFDNDYNIISINYANCLIKVFKNFCYEEPALLNDLDYIHLLQSTTNLSSKYKYVSIHDSHDVVSYLMIFMNHHCAKELLKNKNGIFRCVSNKDKDKHFLPSSLPTDVSQFLKIFSSTSGQYINIESYPEENLLQLCRHETLQLEAYIHITSPIRRIVDLLNMIQFQINNQLIFLSEHTLQFYSTWISKIDYINTTMRSIRQVQNDCNLLEMCFNNDSVIDKIYDGYCFDKSITDNNFFQYMVFISELRISSRIIINHEFDNYTQHKFKLFLFNDEEKFKKKIRLQLIL